MPVTPPNALDLISFRRGWVLLIKGGIDGLSPFFYPSQNLLIVQLWKKQFPVVLARIFPTDRGLTAPPWLELRGQTQMLIALLQQLSCGVILMNAVHNDHFASSGTGVHPGADDTVPPVHGRLNSAQGMAIINVVRIVSNGPIGALASNGTPQRRGDPPASAIVLEAIFLILILRQLKTRSPPSSIPSGSK
jgi:hypothetical protein